MTIEIDQKRRPVLTKRDFVRRYAAGEFGNASPTWETLEAFVVFVATLQLSNRNYHIRNRVAGGRTWYNVPGVSVPRRWNDLVLVGTDPKSLYISAMAPTEKTVLQGEVQRGPGGLQLYYTTVRQPMRDALKVWARQVSGIISVYLLKKFLWASSYEWLEHLLDTYPDHVVEFSAYSVEWGTVRGHNTVFWEVRKY